MDDPIIRVNMTWNEYREEKRFQKARDYRGANPNAIAHILSPCDPYSSIRDAELEVFGESERQLREKARAIVQQGIERQESSQHHTDLMEERIRLLEEQNKRLREELYEAKEISIVPKDELIDVAGGE